MNKQDVTNMSYSISKYIEGPAMDYSVNNSPYSRFNTSKNILEVKLTSLPYSEKMKDNVEVASRPGVIRISSLMLGTK